MKNLIQQEGTMIDIVAPSGGVVSGRGVLIGAALWGVAAVTADEGEDAVIATRGVFELAKTSALAISIGDRVFWDDNNKVVNKTSSAQLCVGVAVSAAGNPSSTVHVKIGPVLPAGT